MKRIILTSGIIGGVIVSAVMLIMISFMSRSSSANYDTGMLVGYASMLVAFSLVFVAIRNYRNNYNGGIISFGKAFKIGILIVLIASTIYVIAWLIYYYTSDSNFMEKYTAHELDKLKASGASQVAIEKQAKEMADLATMYKNPFFNAMMTYVEILPVGLVVTLISSLILKRKIVKS